jgi:hypothetical protein
MSGLTDLAEQAALGVLLPNGIDVWIGFFTALPPTNDGTGGTEASGSGYARKEHQAWINTAFGDITYRVNNGAIEFDALTADLEDIVGWGIWDASVAGTLIAFGPILDVAGNEITKTFTNGNQPRFIDQELKIGLG